MLVDTEHLHHWMCAIRESKDPIRTMDAFWRGQIQSKEWLINEFSKVRHHAKTWPTVDIYGGWVGVLASMMFQSNLFISNIRSIDIDPDCEKIANRMNQLEFEANKFKAITSDMCDLDSGADVIINTSCEHIIQEQYDTWLNRMPVGSLFILQSNNYNIPEHVRIANSLEDFTKQCRLEDILYKGELTLPLYNRWMVIGKKWKAN